MRSDGIEEKTERIRKLLLKYEEQYRKMIPANDYDKSEKESLRIVKKKKKKYG